MGNQIIQQPDGKYAVWSGGIDDFTMIDATPQDIIDERAAEERSRIENAVLGMNLR